MSTAVLAEFIGEDKPNLGGFVYVAMPDVPYVDFVKLGWTGKPTGLLGQHERASPHNWRGTFFRVEDKEHENALLTIAGWSRYAKNFSCNEVCDADRYLSAVGLETWHITGECGGECYWCREKPLSDAEIILGFAIGIEICRYKRACQIQMIATRDNPAEQWEYAADEESVAFISKWARVLVSKPELAYQTADCLKNAIRIRRGSSEVAR